MEKCRWNFGYVFHRTHHNLPHWCWGDRRYLLQKHLVYYLDQILTGDVHIEKTVKTASRRLHYLTVMTRHGLPDDLITTFTTLIRPFLEYSSVLLVSRPAEPELERVQTRACKIIRSRAGNISHPPPSLQARREVAAVKLVRDMHLLPKRRGTCTTRTVRNQHKLSDLKPQANKVKNSTLHIAWQAHCLTSKVFWLSY